MSRLIASLTAVLLAWLGFLPLDTAAAVATDIPVAAHTYVYDGAVSSGAATNTTDRGPPAVDYRGTAYDTDGLRPLGVSARPGDAATSTVYDYDDSDHLVQIASGVPPAERYSSGRAEPVVIEPAGVAANTGAKLGWSTGDDIYSLTKAGNQPAWSTVRGRFWKNEATSPQYGSWTDDQLARMRTGRAPQRYNPDKGGMESMDLSHEPIPFRDGGTSVIPRWPQDHAAVDPFRHPGY